MNSVRLIAIVVLLTIAGSLLLTEAKYHGEDIVPVKYRHKHHRENILSGTIGQYKPSEFRLEMKRHLANSEDEDYDDAYDINEEKRRNRRIFDSGDLAEDDDDDDDNDDDNDNDDNDDDQEEVDYDELEYSEKYPIRHSASGYRYDDDRRRYQRFGANTRGQRTRLDTRFYHDHADPNDTKDDSTELSDYIKALRYSSRKYYSRRHNNHRDNELYVPRWRNSRYDMRIDRRFRGSRKLKKFLHSANKTRGEKNWRNIFKDKDDLEEDDDIWSELDDYDEGSEDIEGNDEWDDDGNEEIGEKPPYRTYDEIIKRLTSNEPTTKTPYKRDYRNTGDIEKFLKFDDYGNLKLDSNNLTNRGILKNLTISDIEILKIGGVKNTNGIRTVGANEGKDKFNRHSHTKSLNRDYVDDWGGDNVNKKMEVSEGDDDEEEDDIDVRNDTVSHVYMDNQNETENETSAPVQSTSTTTTMRTTTRDLRTTASRPAITITTQKTYEYRKNTASISQSQSINGLQSIRGGQKLQAKESKASSPQQHTKKSAEMREALHHALQVSREGSCRWPRARVIPVRDVYPSQGTNYIPHCAILHRCSDDTGCCRSEALTCVPKHSHRVELYFYANSIGGGTEVKKLSFYNDTECICREKTNHSLSTEKRSTLHQHQVTSPPQNIRIPPQKKPCRCPSEFTPRITPEGECQCKCFENDDECVRARRGKVYFSARDRVCIQKEECAMPMCEFGEYIIRQGKCPKKRDKIESIANYPSNNYHHHRPRS